MRISDWSSDVCSSDLILIDRLDDEVAVGERVQFERRGDEAHHLVDLLGLEAALRRAGVVILAHHAQTAVERLLLRLDDRAGEALLQEVQDRKSTRLNSSH